MPLYNLRWKSLPQYSLSCRGVEVGRFTDTLQASVTKGTESIYSQASIKRCPYKQNKCAHATTGNPLTPNTYHLTPIPLPLLKKSTLFTSHLHFPLFRSIFAPAKGTPSRSFFLITSPPTAFHPCYGEVIRPKWLCKRARTSFQLCFFCIVVWA